MGLLLVILTSSINILVIYLPVLLAIYLQIDTGEYNYLLTKSVLSIVLNCVLNCVLIRVSFYVSICVLIYVSTPCFNLCFNN